MSENSTKKKEYYLAYAFNPELGDLAKTVQDLMEKSDCLKSEIIKKNELVDYNKGKVWRIEVIGIFNKRGGDLDLIREEIKNLIQSQYYRKGISLNAS